MDKKINEQLIIGAHFQFNAQKNYFVGVIKEMLRVGASGAALFAGPPQSKLVPVVTDENIQEGLELAKLHNIDVSKFVIHGRYIVNLANPINESNRNFSIDVMVDDIIMANRIGIKYLNFHPGSFLKSSKDFSMKILGDSINEIHQKTKDSNVVLLLETMMNKGSYLGKNFDEIAEIINLVNDKSRIGVCIDTCHIWDGGYDLKENYEGVIEEFDQKIGLKYLKAVHINDSKNILGSGKDRHENLGKGNIGIELFYKFTTDKRFIGIPFLIETPWKDKKTPFYDEEIELLKANFEKNYIYKKIIL